MILGFIARGGNDNIPRAGRMSVWGGGDFWVGGWGGGFSYGVVFFRVSDIGVLEVMLLFCLDSDIVLPKVLLIAKSQIVLFLQF